MTSERVAELDEFYDKGGKDMPSGFATPTPEEAEEYSRIIRGDSKPSGGSKGPTEAHGANTVSGKKQPSQYEAHGANLPRDTAKNSGGASTSGSSSAGGGSSTSSGGGSAGGDRTRGAGGTMGEGAAGDVAEGTVRSMWSQALHDSMADTSGPMRIPFESHPQAGVFANYQAVAQPGFGPDVPSRMPGQPAPPPGMPGMPPGMPGQPAPAMPSPRPMPQAGGPPPMHQMPGGGMMPGATHPGGPGPGPMAPPPRRRPPVEDEYSSLLAQMAMTPAVPGAGPPVRPPMGQQPMGAPMMDPRMRGQRGNY